MPLCALPPGVPQAQAFLPRPVVDLWVSISFNVKCTESKPHLKTCIWWNSWLPRLLLPLLSHWQVLVWVLWGHFSSMMWLINQNINEHLKGMKLLTLVQITAPLYLQLEFYLFHNFSVFASSDTLQSHMCFCVSVRSERPFYGLTTVYSSHTLTPSLIHQIFEYLPCPGRCAGHWASTGYIPGPHRGQ